MRRRLGTDVVRLDPAQHVLGAPLRPRDGHDPVAVLVEDAGVEKLVLRIPAGPGGG